MMGVEPTSPAWKAGVIAVIRHPHETFIIAQNNFFVKPITKKVQNKFYHRHG